MLRKLWNRFGRRAPSTTFRSLPDRRTRLTLELLEERRLLSINVWLDFGANFETRLDEMTANAGVDQFTASEITQIKNGVKSGLETAYTDFAVTFVTTDPAGNNETLDFDEEHASAWGEVVGEIDNLNSRDDSTANIYTGEIEEFIESGDSDSVQLNELIAGMTSIAAHELGHALGLLHQFGYADPTVGNANTSGAIEDTDGDQRAFHMSTFGMGVTEEDFEQVRTFSEFSNASLEFADGLTANPVATTSEQGSAHGSTSTAQRLNLGVRPDLAIAGVRAEYVEQASTSTGTESDFYSFFARDGDVLTVSAQSFASNYVLKTDTMITIYDPAGDELYSTLDDPVGDATSFNDGTGTNWGLDALYVNLPLGEDGEFFIEITSFGNDETGDYDMMATLSGTRFAELDSAGKLTINGTASADTIDLSFDGDDLVVKIGGVVKVKVKKADVTSIEVNLLAGNDTLTVGAGMNKPITVDGGAGADTLNGGDGNDTLEGGTGNDTLVGGDGSDTYVFSGGDDLGTDIIIEADSVDTDTLDFSGLASAMVNLATTGNQTVLTNVLVLNLSSALGLGIEDVIGTPGADTITGNSRNNVINGGAGNDFLRGEAGADQLYGGGGDDYVYGGPGNDFIYGNDGVDNLFGEGDDDYVYGGNGNDNIRGGDGDDHLFGDDDNDTLTGGLGADVMYGGLGGDAVYGGAGNDKLYGEAGADILHGEDDNDLVYGGPGIDTIDGGDGADVLYGDGDGDTIHGGNGADNVYGGAGNDFLHGDAGADFLFGEGDNDYVYGGAGNDWMSGGGGADHLFGEGGDDTIYAGIGDDVVYGGANDDLIYGGAGGDTIYGGGGADDIFGEGGDDTLYGDDGDDVISGGTGNDFGRGDAGNDTQDGSVEDWLD